MVAATVSASEVGHPQETADPRREFSQWVLEKKMY